jgi:hypothetical protein
MRVPLVIVAATVRLASAEPAMLLDRCPAFEPAALRASIDRELAAAREPIRDDLALRVECRDPFTVRLIVHSPQLTLEHGLDLGEVETELRARLLVLSAVELLKVASAPRGPDGRLAVPADVVVTPQPPPKPAPVRVARVEPDVTVAKQAPRDHREPRVFAIAPRAGVRVFSDQPVPLAHLAVDLEWWRFSLGLSGSAGSTDDALGSLRPYLATVTASAQLSCFAGRRDRACLRVRGETGLAAVTARGTTNAVRATDASAFYGQLGLGIDAEHAFGALAALLAVDAAWAEGLVVTAQSRTPVRLDGPAFTTVIGVRWRR